MFVVVRKKILLQTVISVTQNSNEASASFLILRLYTLSLKNSF